MELKEFMESHDEALEAKHNILHLINNGKKGYGMALFDIDKLNEELPKVFKHIELLEGMLFAVDGE